MEAKTRHVLANPMAKANYFSKYFTYWWLNDLFRKGNKKPLQDSDVYHVLPDDQTEGLAYTLNRLWNEELANAQSRNRKPRLRNAFVKFLGWRYALYGAFPLLEEMALLGGPLLIGRLLSFFNPLPGISRIDAYLTAFGLSFLLFLNSVLHAPNFFKNTRCGMQLRIAAGTLIYRKALRLSHASIAKTTTGRIVNLLTSDVQKLEEGTAFYHYLWVTPVNVILVMFFAWQELGPSVLPGMVLLLLFAPLNGWIGQLFASLRLKTATLTDERIKGMNEIIAGMRVIKLYTWEKLFEMFVAGLRRLEVKAVKRSSFIRAISTASYQFIIPVICLVVFTTYVMTDHSLTTKKLFVVLGLFNLSRALLTIFFPTAVMGLKVASVSEKRLQEFLLMEECRSNILADEESIVNKGSAVVQLKNVTAFWDKSLNATLTNISLEAKPGELHMIVGPVGAGKSSLLMALLSELPISKGKMTVLGKIGYASQNSWLFSGTVRENIVFGQPFDEDKYRRVIDACALQKDLELFHNADMTLVGERGVIVSGGQKARINLARAVYYNADIYLLDDPLSAVDTLVGRELFNRCILTLLKDKVCLVVTHQLQYLKDATSITCLREGRCVAQGPVTELLELGLDLRSVISLPALDSDSDVDGDDINVEEMQQKSIVTRKFKPEEPAQSTSEAEEKIRRTGTVTWEVYFGYWKVAASFPVLALLVLLLLGTQVLVVISDWWLSRWADIEEEMKYKASLKSNATTVTEDPSQTRERVILIYVFLVFGTILAPLTTAVLFLYVTVSASENLHNKMFASILRAPIYFFDTNPVGSVLNRFSKDIGQMDDTLPFTFFDYSRLLVFVFAILVLNVFAMPFLLLVAVPLVALFLYMRNYYLKSSRQIKRIEALNRSPFYSHLSTSLEGLTSIRAYTAQGAFIRQHHVYQDDHTASWFLFLTTSRWLGSRLDFMSFVFGVMAVFTPLLLAESGRKMSAGLVGLSLTYVRLLAGTFQWCVRQSAEVENMMTSTERVMEYSRLEQEPQGNEGTLEVPVNWPKYGIITFERVYYAHHPTMPYVLKNLNLCIRSEEKVGIVGRTGAGKSSLVAALFRMAEPQGLVRIDGIPITDIRLHDLRSRLSVIPQDPVLFSGSLRRNLDPFDLYGDRELWNALDEVQLKQVVTELPDGLQTKLTEGGSNFSVGQRQLVCLARAILKHNKILIIDEATANVDHRTDSLIQETIRTKFQRCTVLTIAHRLNTIMDCDRVLVLHEGQIVEFDEPYVLLQNEHSLFSAMVDDTSKNEAANLHEMAHQAYIARRESSRYESDNDRRTSLGDVSRSRLCMPLINSAFLKERNGLSSPFITRDPSEEKGIFLWETAL